MRKSLAVAVFAVVVIHHLQFTLFVLRTIPVVSLWDIWCFVFSTITIISFDSVTLYNIMTEFKEAQEKTQ